MLLPMGAYGFWCKHSSERSDVFTVGGEASYRSYFESTALSPDALQSPIVQTDLIVDSEAEYRFFYLLRKESE